MHAYLSCCFSRITSVTSYGRRAFVFPSDMFLQLESNPDCVSAFASSSPVPFFAVAFRTRMSAVSACKFTSALSTPPVHSHGQTHTHTHVVSALHTHNMTIIVYADTEDAHLHCRRLPCGTYTYIHTQTRTGTRHAQVGHDSSSTNRLENPLHRGCTSSA